MYDPCYSPNLGLVGFRCRVADCKKVVRSYRGIVMHCKRVHKLEAQMAFPGFKEKKNGKEASSEVVEPVRAERTAADTPRNAGEVGELLAAKD